MINHLNQPSLGIPCSAHASQGQDKSVLNYVSGILGGEPMLPNRTAHEREKDLPVEGLELCGRHPVARCLDILPRAAR